MIRISQNDADLLDYAIGKFLKSGLPFPSDFVLAFVEFSNARTAAEHRRAEKENRVFDRLPIEERSADRIVRHTSKTYVVLPFKTGKSIAAALDNFLVSFPFEKDNFFSGLCNLERSIKRAESKERA